MKMQNPIVEIYYIALLKSRRSLVNFQTNNDCSPSMNSHTFHEDFQALSQLLQSSEDAFVQKSQSNSSLNTEAISSSSQTQSTRSSLQEKIEKESLDRPDGRSVPECEILYQQSVETTDAFLGLSQKTPSTVSCENLLVKIYLPEVESLTKVHLDCKENRVLLSSKEYKLFKYLPHEVDQDQGKAQWFNDRKLLTIELPIKIKGLNN